MKSSKKRSREPKPVKGMVAAAILVLIGLVFFIQSKEVKVTPPQTESKGNSPYSSSTLTTFWESEIKPIAFQWAEAKFPYPEVNTRSAYLASKIQERTHKGVHTHASFNYHWAAKTVSATSGFDTNENEVTMTLHIPALLDSFNRLEKSGRADWKTVFQTYLTIMLMHEMEHGGYDGLMPKSAVTLNEESRAWAETCRHTIVPLVEIHHLPVHSLDETFYKAWRESGGDTNHPAWQQALKKFYGLLDNLPQK